MKTPPNVAEAIAALAQGGPARRNVLAGLSSGVVTLDATQLLPALVARLDDDDRWDAMLALEAIGHLGTREAIEVLAARVGKGPIEERATAAFWLAYRGEDRGALDAIEAVLFAPVRRSRTPNDPRFQATRALELLARKGSAAARARAQAIAERCVRGGLAATENGEVNQVMNAFRALEGSGRETELLELALRESPSGLLRGVVLGRLGKLGQLGVDALSSALADADLREAAARALAGRDEPGLVDAVAAALAVEEDEDVCGALVGFLIGHPDRLAKILPKIERKLGGWTRMQLRWIAQGIGPREAAEQLAGAIDRPPARGLKALATKWTRTRDPHVVLELFGEPRLEWFDTETADPVSDHAALCKRLARLAGDALRGLDAEQQGSAREKRYQVRVTAGARAHPFTVRNLGDWYDVDAVLDGLDALLVAARRPERYFALETGDQTALVVCLPGAPFRKAAAALGIPIVRRRSHARRSPRGSSPRAR